jgi:hypothetical protein
MEKEIQEPGKDPRIYHWALWDMRFAPGEKTALKVRYRIKPRKNHDPIVTPYRRAADRIRADSQGQPVPPEVQQVLDGIVSLSTGYIMVTGSQWYDTIERAAVTVRHPNGAAALRWIDPVTDFAVVPEGIRWQFSHIKPDFDISVEFHAQWTLQEERRAVQEALARSERRQGLKDHLRYLEKLSECLSAGDCRP